MNDTSFSSENKKGETLTREKKVGSQLYCIFVGYVGLLTALVNIFF